MSPCFFVLRLFWDRNSDRLPMGKSSQPGTRKSLLNLTRPSERPSEPPTRPESPPLARLATEGDTTGQILQVPPDTHNPGWATLAKFAVHRPDPVSAHSGHQFGQALPLSHASQQRGGGAGETFFRPPWTLTIRGGGGGGGDGPSCAQPVGRHPMGGGSQNICRPMTQRAPNRAIHQSRLLPHVTTLSRGEDPWINFRRTPRLQ